jgi:hypothetical protein
MIPALLALFITQAYAHPGLRIDKTGIEEITPHAYKYELIISDNCPHCINQLRILKSCVADKDVVVFIDNRSKASEAILKRLVKKKEIKYPVYLLDSYLKDAYQFKGITPTLWMNKKSYTGIVNCDFLKQ